MKAALEAERIKNRLALSKAAHSPAVVHAAFRLMQDGPSRQAATPALKVHPGIVNFTFLAFCKLNQQTNKIAVAGLICNSVPGLHAMHLDVPMPTMTNSTHALQKVIEMVRLVSPAVMTRAVMSPGPPATALYWRRFSI